VKGWLRSIWWVRTYVKRTTLGGQERTEVRFYPRVSFRWGFLQYTMRRGAGVWWSPRRVVWEGDIVYKHHFTIEYPRVMWE
jgi:hypothetical protein